jgi:hypothetical protein
MITTARTEGAHVTRVEWGVIASLLISALSLAFSFGVIYADVQRHEKRIELVEGKVDDFAERLARIDANVTFLAEQAREQRIRER